MGRYFRNVRYGSNNFDVGLDAVLTLEMLLDTLIGRGRRGGAGSGHWMRPTPRATQTVRRTHAASWGDVDTDYSTETLDEPPALKGIDFSWATVYWQLLRRNSHTSRVSKLSHRHFL
jgi:hypothetical protein